LRFSIFKKPLEVIFCLEKYKIQCQKYEKKTTNRETSIFDFEPQWQVCGKKQLCIQSRKYVK
jgi:hypothetical protein